MKTLEAFIIPHSPYWAIHGASALQLFTALKNTTVAEHEPAKLAHVAALRAEVEASREVDAKAREDKYYDVRDGIAIFDLSGPMTKMSASYGGGTSTASLRQRIDAAMGDKDVKGALIRIDSPGGSVAGTGDLAETVAAFAKRKPIYAYIEDMGASAAMWVASQCTKVYANKTALVGSLGTYAVIYDMSRAAANEGIDVHLFTTGKYKGAGTPGTKITDEQAAEFQASVDDLNEHFMTAFSQGRGMSKSQAKEIFDGAVHVASKALKLNMIDGVSTYERVFDQARNASYNRTISSEDVAPAAMTLAEDTETLLADADGVIARANAIKTRIEVIKDARSEDGRDLGPKAIGHIDDTCHQLGEVSVALQSLKPVMRDDGAEARAALARTLLEVSIAS